MIEYNQFRQMTPTAIELWNDKKFIEKRIIEQQMYESIVIWKEECGEISRQRLNEILPSIYYQEDRFKKRLRELN